MLLLIPLWAVCSGGSLFLFQIGDYPRRFESRMSEEEIRLQRSFEILKELFF